MPILFMLIMLVLIWFGFHLLAAIITSVAPGAAFLFHDNGIATFIFSLSLFMGFPLVVCVPIAIIAGFIFADKLLLVFTFGTRATLNQILQFKVHIILSNI